MIDYLKNPQEIYRRSFETIRRETALDGLPEDIAAIATRLIHASGMTDLVADLRWSPQAAARGIDALRNGAPIYTDVEMTAAGIIQKRLPAGNAVRCWLRNSEAQALAESEGTTRSAAGIACWPNAAEGAIAVIGNAPTALFRLLEEIAADRLRPALILGFPVGFVGAVESKAALAEGGPTDTAYITLLGRRGGSAMAAAALNALAHLAGDAS